jgi:hypothetical protein
MRAVSFVEHKIREIFREIDISLSSETLMDNSSLPILSTFSAKTLASASHLSTV